MPDYVIVLIIVIVVVVFVMVRAFRAKAPSSVITIDETTDGEVPHDQDHGGTDQR